MLPALTLIAAAVGRVIYPTLLERRKRRRRTFRDDGIVHGAEPIVLELERGPGVLLLHGGGDTPQVLGDLARHLHARGFAVRAPLFSGHGRDLAALRKASAPHWLDEARRELDTLRATHEQVSIVGLSMGGAMAAILAADRDDLQSLVLLAPYIEMPPTVRRLARTSPLWGWLVPYFSTRGAASIHDPAAKSRGLGDGLFTPAALRALLEIVIAADAALPRVQAPTLIVQSREDNRIAHESAERAFARLGAAEKRFVWTSGAGHVITVDYGHERVYDLTLRWLERYRDSARRSDRRPRIKP